MSLASDHKRSAAFAIGLFPSLFAAPHHGRALYCFSNLPTLSLTLLAPMFVAPDTSELTW